MNYSRQAIKYDIIPPWQNTRQNGLSTSGSRRLNMSEQPACYTVETMTDYPHLAARPHHNRWFNHPAQIDTTSPFFHSIMLTWLLP